MADGELPTKGSILRPTGTKGGVTAPTLRGMARAGTSDISRHGSPAGGVHRREWRQVKSSLGLANGKYSAQVIHFNCETLANIIVIDVWNTQIT